MGAGNVCTIGRYEGLYYIDKDLFTVYTKDAPYSDDEYERSLAKDLSYEELTGGEWYEDEEGSDVEWGDIEEHLREAMTARFPSFRGFTAPPVKWMRSGPYGLFSRRVLLENKLFCVCVEDNQWSVAIELIQKEEPWGLPWMENLQGRFYQAYMYALRDVLLERLPYIGTYAGAWTHGIITREEASC